MIRIMPALGIPTTLVPCFTLRAAVPIPGFDKYAELRKICAVHAGGGNAAAR